ncbi:MAG TPA: heptaprenyl diphosphate synthase component 1 [Metalysinibacillus jejuensis]|uniref:Heptaprenyl diphosphate synthase component 1 n=1 Tax=Metalysinibacillus jejuensis TaxID=914327 RepID=A0A921NCA6_9BACL|nr:heptaprenyl diphosphate synthase component 1 [Metalysinibacillus jejuensis]HJH11846.1 heptaprenyl diphosphate synthase component 1 [Metalysinibacillus jejuensis]
MNVTDAQNELQRFKEAVFKHVRHRTLQQFTGAPIVDDTRMFYALLPFFNKEATEAHEANAVVLGVVHAALAAHDLIEEQATISKEQQLIVLAGDYYSGRYYQLLAASHDIALIQALSQAIIVRCEQKAKAYETDPLTVEQWLMTLQQMESVLISSYFTCEQFAAYIPIAEQGLLLVRLYEEQQQLSRLSERLATPTETLAIIAEQIATLEQEMHTMIEEADFLLPSVKALIVEWGMKKSEA